MLEQMNCLDKAFQDLTLQNKEVIFCANYNLNCKIGTCNEISYQYNRFLIATIIWVKSYISEVVLLLLKDAFPYCSKFEIVIKYSMQCIRTPSEIVLSSTIGCSVLHRSALYILEWLLWQPVSSASTPMPFRVTATVSTGQGQPSRLGIWSDTVSNNIFAV